MLYTVYLSWQIREFAIWWSKWPLMAFLVGGILAPLVLNCSPMHGCTQSALSVCVCIPVTKEPFAEIINGSESESCSGGSSHSWLWVIFISWPAALWKHKPPLYLDQQTMKCVNWRNFSGLVHRGKHSNPECCALVEDTAERQGDWRVRENSQEPEGHKADSCEEPMWLSRRELDIALFIHLLSTFTCRYPTDMYPRRQIGFSF